MSAYAEVTGTLTLRGVYVPAEEQAKAKPRAKKEATQPVEKQLAGEITLIEERTFKAGNTYLVVTTSDGSITATSVLMGKDNLDTMRPSLEVGRSVSISGLSRHANDNLVITSLRVAA